MSSISSYQTLARYDDSPGRSRARDLDDIRTKQRESLRNSRLQMRCLKMLQYRRTLATLLTTPGHKEDFTSDGEDECDSPFGHSSSSASDDAWGICRDQISSWESPSRFTPSPSPSMSSTSSQVSQDSTSDHLRVPRFFLEVEAPSIKQLRRQMKSNSHLRNKSYKKYTALYSNPRLSKGQLDETKVKADLEGLTQLLNQFQESHYRSNLISQNYQVILDATNSTVKETRRTSLNLLTDLATANLLDEETLLNLIRNGLLFNLQHQFLAIDDAINQVIEFFSQVAKFNPSLLPYIIDIMQTSAILDDLRERVACRSTIEEVLAIVRFYHQLSSALIAQLNQTTPPVLPEILRQTGLTREILASYSPISTFIKCFNSELISDLIRKLEINNQHEVELLNTILVILAHAISVAQNRFIDDDWLAGFQSSIYADSLRERIDLLIEQLTSEEKKKADYDNLRGGCLVDTCKQFASYFQQYQSRLPQ